MFTLESTLQALVTMNTDEVKTQTSLLEVFRSIKNLWSYLPAQTWRALRATNTEMHQLVYTNASSVQLHSGSDIALLISQHWPQLTTLKLGKSNITEHHIAWLVQGDLQLQCLDLSHIKLTSAGVKQLVCGKWSALAYLNLAQSFGHVRCQDARGVVASCRHLAHSDWPALTVLNISNNNLSVNALAELVQADWPGLQDLDVSANQKTELDDDRPWSKQGHGFFTQLAQAPWTGMQDLNISANLLDYEDALCMSQLKWHHLTGLNICGSLKHLEADERFQIVRQMAMGTWWSQLKALDISDNGLPPSSMAELIWGELPQLQMLDLRGSISDAEDIVAVLNSSLHVLKAFYVSSEVFAPVQARPESVS